MQPQIITDLEAAWRASSYPAAGISLDRALADQAMRTTLELRVRMAARHRAFAASLAGTTYLERSAPQ